ncbi:transporter substrate-binding domain-containing protein [Vibrio sp. Of7-15]|uniref:substrate-binding periplasmic protein n=1 Tax=Vibrio sp. Of7-15 TaxID=2724879 RepID=UPI001EF23060|nr:transporter substrate-binding domain-containing protein [Vibrio sp. Of7-15]MCG7497883.1 transporter substrate-binding domain-containing protein [Vibrio sp. Of7-15]
MSTKRFWILSVFSFQLFSFLFSIPAASKEKTIVLATDEWAPYYSRHLKQQGFLAEITKEAFHRAGYDCQIKFVPWERAMTLAQKGIYDGILGAYHTHQREEYFHYSLPITEDQLHFFWLKDREIQYRELQDLVNYKIGVVKGYNYGDEFERANYLNKIGNYNVESNVLLLLKGRIDILVGSKKVINMILEENHFSEQSRVQMSEIPLISQKLYILISHQSQYHENALSDFNHSFKSMETDGTIEAILSKHGF